ncbi:hypothetical protein TNCV_2004781 [Trichonephila clavipes]|nr:hypothetical protein TNCV_2004781 [Trichonephila clavipes]
MNHVAVTNATCLTMSDQNPPNSSRQRTKCTPVVNIALSTIQGTVHILALFHPNFVGEHPKGGQGLLTSLSPPTSQEDLWLDGYLEYPMPQRHHTFTNIYASSGIFEPIPYGTAISIANHHTRWVTHTKKS